MLASVYGEINNNSNAILQTRGFLCTLLWVVQQLAPFPMDNWRWNTLHLVCVHDQAPPSQHHLWGRLTIADSYKSYIPSYKFIKTNQDHMDTQVHLNYIWESRMISSPKIPGWRMIQHGRTWIILMWRQPALESSSILSPIIRPGCVYVIGCTGYIPWLSTANYTAEHNISTSLILKSPFFLILCDQSQFCG